MSGESRSTSGASRQVVVDVVSLARAIEALREVVKVANRGGGARETWSAAVSCEKALRSSIAGDGAEDLWRKVNEVRARLSKRIVRAVEIPPESGG